MRTRKILTGVFLFVSFCAQAQIVNGEFDDWTASGNPAPFDWEEPTGWTTINSLTEWTAAGVERSSDYFTADYACQITSTFVNNGWPSMLCNGSAELTNVGGNPMINFITGGEPLNFVASSLVGYYKFDNSDVLDSAVAFVVTKKYNPTTLEYDTVGYGETVLPPALDYSTFIVEIKEVTAGVVADSIVIGFMSTKLSDPKGPNFPAVGLLIDNLTLTEAPSTVDELWKSKNIANKVYPNPSNGLVYLSGINDQMVTICDVTGKQVLRPYVSEGGVVDLSGLKNGVYVIHVGDGGVIRVLKSD